MIRARGFDYVCGSFGTLLYKLWHSIVEVVALYCASCGTLLWKLWHSIVEVVALYCGSCGTILLTPLNMCFVEMIT